MSMLNAFRTDRVHVELSLVKYTDGDSEGRTFPIKTRKTYAPPNEFIYLRAHIRNVSRTVCFSVAFFIVLIASI